MRFYLTFFIIFLATLNKTFAQNEELLLDSSNSDSVYLNLLIIAFAATIFVLLLVAITLLRTFKSLSNELLNPSPINSEETKRMEYLEWIELQKSKSNFWSKLLELKPISEEKDIRLEHEFDGIAELDNPTPKWFMWLFYSTIVIAVGYMCYYHVFNWGPLQTEEYAIEMMEAETAKKEYLAKAANLIDENSVKEDTDANVISAGKAIYNTNCIACHGDKAQGGVGPNLTDAYWLHGGTINSIFKTIKYGVPEKGMISWEKTLSPKQIGEVSNFIQTLKGSSPSNPKPPQGEKEG